MNINLKNAMNAYFYGAKHDYPHPDCLRARIEGLKEGLSEQNKWHQIDLESGALKRDSAEYNDSIRLMESFRTDIRDYEAELSVSERAYAFWEAAAPLTEAITEAEGRATARTLTAYDICAVLKDVEERCPTKKALNGTVVYYDGGEKFPSAYKYTPESTHFTAEFKNGSWRITNIFRDTCPNHQAKGRIEYSEAAKEAILKMVATI